ncbi:hypothetical protein [Erythrobacter sp. SD-21]|uniref:hypothetical protein n=1 Tax=Erythrobacter sp. SD-21 TaxID=161528 RepID=UPI0012EA096B|nr:hypothetical protein [Erythrobacter sp. SD-21]
MNWLIEVREAAIGGLIAALFFGTLHLAFGWPSELNEVGLLAVAFAVITPIKRLISWAHHDENNA